MFEFLKPTLQFLCEIPVKFKQEPTDEPNLSTFDQQEEEAPLPSSWPKRFILLLLVVVRLVTLFGDRVILPPTSLCSIFFFFVKKLVESFPESIKIS